MTNGVIEISALVKDHVSPFLQKRVRVLDGLTLTVQQGQTFGLLGPNGAGKTTTIKLSLGLLKPTAGEVKVLDCPAGSKTALSRIGFLPENPYFYSYLTGWEFLDFFGQLFNLSTNQRKERAKELLEMVSLTDAAHKPIHKFSKGMLQRLGIAQCLINEPDVLFLDEPNSGLDPIGRKDIRNILLKLKQAGKTIFLNSHLLPDVNELCDQIGVLHKGKLIAGGKVASICPSGNYKDLEQFFFDVISSCDKQSQPKISSSS
jgi:ABC-2 type transport system ATP-binding protein